MSRQRVVINKTHLHELYWDKNYSPYKIGSLIGCSFATIANRLREYDIPLKSPSQARQRYPKKDFSGDKVEKAYMVGFRIGDLNVYKTSSAAETVVVRCHSTDDNQVNLIKNLFDKYGKVTVSDGIGKYQINCFLNKTFEFLLPKFGYPPKEFSSKKQILSFIAGYVDAEGSIGLNQSRARLKIDSYDKGVLHWMHDRLQDLKIDNNLRCIGLKNNVHYNQVLNRDLWRLNINKGRELFRFINLTYPYIKHSRRKQQLAQAKINLLLRIRQGNI